MFNGIARHFADQIVGIFAFEGAKGAPLASPAQGRGRALPHASASWRHLAACIALLMSGLPPALAAWPERQVTIIVPYAAGGNTDTMARMAAEWLTGRLRQPFIVENRGGAGGAIATAYVGQAAPDGYTVLFGSTAQLLIAPLVQKVAYDPHKDFAPVATFGSGPNILAVSTSLPVNTVQELIRYAKANPARINYATGGNGTVGHLYAALFAARAELDMVHISYSGGAPATTSLVGGHVQMYFGNASELLPHASGGRIKLLAVTSKARMAQIPNVPTVEEVYPGFRLSFWNGFVAPAKAPLPALETLARETVAATRDAGIVKRLLELGIEPGGIALEAFQKEINDDRRPFEDAVKAAGLKVN